MSNVGRIGVLTGGGDAPGLNAVIRAVVKAASNAGIEVDRPRRQLRRPARPVAHACPDAAARHRHPPAGGHDPRNDEPGEPVRLPGRRRERRTPTTRSAWSPPSSKMKLDALVVIGGDGTLQIAHQFYLMGIPVVGVPKTIDNDIWGTTSCFGFDTAVSFAADAIDRLHTTAEAHRRIMVVEVMGRYAGWIALHAGVAGGADVILIPEIPYDLDKIAQRLREREKFRRAFQHRRRRRRRKAGRWGIHAAGARQGRPRRAPRRCRGRGRARRCRRRPARRRGRSSSAICNAAARRPPSIASWPRGSAARPWSC